jgi:tRNA dimethylallyltransferase
LPAASANLREQLNQYSEGELFVRLKRLDPETAQAIDVQNKRRLIRAVEICLLSGRPASEQRRREEPNPAPAGVFLFRERDDLYVRIDVRVKAMFANGLVDEVSEAETRGPTAARTLGLQQIRDLLAEKISERDCIAAIQQATRRYAKRQLTWFQRQTNFEPLNLSLQGSSDAIEWISRKARQAFADTDV